MTGVSQTMKDEVISTYRGLIYSRGCQTLLLSWRKPFALRPPGTATAWRTGRSSLSTRFFLEDVRVRRSEPTLSSVWKFTGLCPASISQYPLPLVLTSSVMMFFAQHLTWVIYPFYRPHLCRARLSVLVLITWISTYFQVIKKVHKGQWSKVSYLSLESMLQSSVRACLED